MKTLTALRYLKDLWDEKTAATLDEPEQLRYRSNLLGADLRITNFGGGNTSSKVLQIDPLTGHSVDVLWVKGSGGDLGSIKRAGFATLYLDKLLAIEKLYKGVAQEDAVVDLYPLCTFGVNPTVASIDTPLHGFLPFRHVDHLHPDWGIAMAAAANGKEKMEEFNREYEHKLVWVPWQRPGFELGLMMRGAVQENPGCDGIVLGGHGLFTWGETQRECYLNTLAMIDHLGQFVQEHIERKGAAIFGGAALQSRPGRKEIAIELLPFVRGRVSQQRRFIGSWSDGDDVMRFVNSKDGAALAHLGTSCPDHFIRTKIRPMFVPAAADDDAQALQKKIEAALDTYRAEYAGYYRETSGANLAGDARFEPDRGSDPRCRHVLLRQKQERVPRRGRVLHECDSRDGRSYRARRRLHSERFAPSRRRCALRSFRGLLQLCRASRGRGLPHRVLAA